MDDLPEVVFKRVLGYLSLQDRLKARSVSRTWYNRINSSRVKSLSFYGPWSDPKQGTRRLLSGAYAQNSICSRRFDEFFNTFSQSILSHLKRLTLCGAYLGHSRPVLQLPLDVFYERKCYLKGVDVPTFVRTLLHSFDQLEELAMINFYFEVDPDDSAELRASMDFELNLPKLKSLHVESFGAVKKLTVCAPRLQRVLINASREDFRVNLVHDESVEKLIIKNTSHIAVEKLKNLKFFYLRSFVKIESKFLSSLSNQLKEFHILENQDLNEIFQWQQRRTDLKIFYHGLHLNCPNDQANSAILTRNLLEIFPILVENPSRVADEIPLCSCLNYSAIECVVRGSENIPTVLKRFTDLERIEYRPEFIKDNERFLNFKKDFGDLLKLEVRRESSSSRREISRQREMNYHFWKLSDKSVSRPILPTNGNAIN